MCISGEKIIALIIKGTKKIIKIYKGIIKMYEEKIKVLEEETNIVLNDILSGDEDTETVIDMTEEEINETLDYIIGG